MIESKTVEDEKRLGEASFSVLARVAMQLGRESISNSIVAIIELVKNSYDADAENVYIEFQGLDTDNPVLHIRDDGNGMSRDQLESQWLVIGTPNKLNSGRSTQKGRILTGEKGLGRLGLDRLCKQTVLQTFTEHDDFGTKLVIDWTKYENTDARLESVKHNLYSISKAIASHELIESVSIGHGTWLMMSDLKDSWSKESLSRLRDELTLLVSPFAGINDFSIEIATGMVSEDIDGRIDSDFMLDVAEWNLKATLGDEGNVTITVTSNQYDDKFTLGPQSWETTFRTGNTKPQCGPLDFEMYFFPRRKVEIGGFNLSHSQVNEFLNANNGVRIYRDSFRVKPYGSPDGTGDWLRLSYRRQQNPQGVTQKPIGGWKVGYNQVVGAVFISREKNTKLIDQTNRENLVEGPAFADMRMFVDRAIQFFEIKRQEFEIARLETKLTDLESAKDEVESTASVSRESVSQAMAMATDIRNAVESGTVPSPAILEDLTKTLERLDDTLQQNRVAQEEYERQTVVQQELLQRQKDTLGNLASLGILATSFGHETQGSSNLVLTNARDLHKDLNAGLFMVDPNLRADIEEELRIILHEADKIETFAKFMLKNIRRDKRHRQAIDLVLVINRVFSFFTKLLAEKNIQIELILPDKLPPILAFEIDWESIFINLIVNSVWALEDIASDKKRIRVAMEEVDGSIIIDFSDSGIGIEKGTEKQIFLPTISTKRNDRGEIIGTGMGLSIAKDFVESHDGGTIDLEPESELGGARFLISVNIPNLHLRGQR